MNVRCLALLSACMLPLAAGIARAEWQEASTTHFVVYADDAPARVRAYAEELERYDEALRALRSVPARAVGKAGRVTVFMLDSTDDIHRLYGKGGDHIAGFYQARAEGSVAFVPRKSNDYQSGLNILLHEYAHHFMATNWSSAAFPMWYAEGFAEFHATAEFGRDGSIRFGTAPTSRVVNRRMTQLMPLKRLLLPDPGKMDELQTFALYSRGWLLTHFVTFDDRRRQQLGTYITAVSEGRSAEEAARAFGDLSDIELDNYGARKLLPALTLRGDALPAVSVQVRALGPGEAQTMPARIRSARGVDKDSAPVVAELARKLAAPFAADASAQNELAEAEYDAGQYGAAEAAADRALAVDARSVHALLYKGMARMAMARRDRTTDPQVWRDARNILLAANKVDPDDPAPLKQFYLSFGQAGQPATDSARNGLLAAYILAPEDGQLRLLAGQLLLQMDRASLARSALRPVAYSPHPNEATERAAKALAALEASGPAAALEALSGVDDPENTDRH